MDIEFREAERDFSKNVTHCILYAYVKNEQIAALDFTKSGVNVCVNMIFVKPQYRRRGIGRAMVNFLVSHYSNSKIACGRPLLHGGSPAQALHLPHQSN